MLQYWPKQRQSKEAETKDNEGQLYLFYPLIYVFVLCESEHTLSRVVALWQQKRVPKTQSKDVFLYVSLVMNYWPVQGAWLGWDRRQPRNEIGSCRSITTAVVLLSSLFSVFYWVLLQKPDITWHFTKKMFLVPIATVFSTDNCCEKLSPVHFSENSFVAVEKRRKMTKLLNMHQAFSNFQRTICYMSVLKIKGFFKFCSIIDLKKIPKNQNDFSSLFQ